MEVPAFHQHQHAVKLWQWPSAICICPDPCLASVSVPGRDPVGSVLALAATASPVPPTAGWASWAVDALAVFCGVHRA